jgi:ATPase subunit of ABC transporter with duplicated ATPase domains
MAMSRQKKLDKMDVIELAQERPKPEFHFQTARTPSKLMFEAKGLVIGYDEPLSRPLDLMIERGQKIALHGANGIGKSTLLKSLLGEIPSVSGTVERGENLHIGYFEQEIKEKNSNTCIEEIWGTFPSLTQQQVRAMLAKCGLMTKHIESKIEVLSGGEKAKVRLCKLMNTESNILVLDEPTNHLDVEAKEELKRALQAYKGTVLLISHEPEFYEAVATDLWNCESWTTKVF